ncbi:MAG: transporter [Methylophilaceae bacterium]
MANQQKIAFAIVMLAFNLTAHASCGGAFCTLNTDAGVQGTWNKPGVRLDIRGEFINLDQLRHGSSKAAPSGEVNEHDETRTLNRNFLATLDWNINQDWGVTLRLPFVNRAHNHIFNADNGAGGVDPEVESWNFSGIGDLQALARYNFYSDGMSNAGVRFGLKLPTGSINKANSEEKAERTLQPGSGSLDTMLGAYYNQHHGSIGWFVQGMWQQTVHDRDDFKPGTKLGVDAGLSYAATPDLSLMLQTNLQYKAKDSGVNAEPKDSGGHSISISPGLAYKLTEGTQIYGFVQKPIYQYVNGAQLTSDWSVAVGLSTHF